MKKRGGSAKTGDVIPYIFCLSEGEESAKTSQADRAKHPDELRRGTEGLTIGKWKLSTPSTYGMLNNLVDYDHYLSHQILPPIERLCEPIEGTDRARLAECLGTYLDNFKCSLLNGKVGLDPMRFKTSTAGEERVFSGLDSQISDAERFRDAAPFLVRCRHCQGRLSFFPLNSPEVFLRRDFYQLFLIFVIL